MIRSAYIILLLLMLSCIGCEWRLKPNDGRSDDRRVSIERYDRLESQYLMLGDYAALQQMKTAYPMQTRMLVEDVLRLGKVSDADINAKFRQFFQDSTLQKLVSDVQTSFSDMDDLNASLNAAFVRMKEELPALRIPKVYAQIGSFDQSIIVGANSLGICLDKYLGEDYPFYQEHYPERERRMMVRRMIVPDCLSFYLLSVYPMKRPHEEMTRQEIDMHMGRIQWVVNQLVGTTVFDNDRVATIGKFMKKHKGVSYDYLFRLNDHTIIQATS